MDNFDYYEILGISPDATQDEINKAYRNLSKKYHPDLNPGDSKAAEYFKKINKSYEVLSDPDKRKEYDYQRQGGFFHDGFSPFEGIFREFSRFFGDDPFGNEFHSRDESPGDSRRNIYRGDDVKVDVYIELEDIIKGVSKKIKYKRWVRCSSCGGVSEKDSCDECDGKGTKIIFSEKVTIKITCEKCKGSGKLIGKSCSHCNGGLVQQETEKEISLPPGVTPYTTFVIGGLGSESVYQNGKNGDLCINVMLKPHKLFQILDDGNILYVQEVDYATLVCGGDIEVPTLHGNVVIKLPECTAPNTLFRIKGKGIPIRNIYNDGLSDQIVKIKLKFPKKITKKYKKLLNKLREVEHAT